MLNCFEEFAKDMEERRSASAGKHSDTGNEATSKPVVKTGLANARIYLCLLASTGKCQTEISRILNMHTSTTDMALARLVKMGWLVKTLRYSFGLKKEIPYYRVVFDGDLEASEERIRASRNLVSGGNNNL